jgi:hypothetical protein
MPASIKSNPIPRVVALLIVSISLALLMKGFDASMLAKLDSMSAAEVIQHERSLHLHSVSYQFFLMLVMGGFYMGAVDFLTYLIALPFKNGAA